MSYILNKESNVNVKQKSVPLLYFTLLFVAISNSLVTFLPKKNYIIQRNKPIQHLNIGIWSPKFLSQHLKTMAQRNIEMLLSMFFVVVTLWGVTVAQIDSSCANVLISLSPCLDYITGQTSTPSSGCCSQLASVMGSQPQCLCEVVNGGASSIAASLNINQTRALGLPTACNVQTPLINTCSGMC
jgi:hypothetical protein